MRERIPIVIVGAGSHGRGLKEIINTINARSTFGIYSFKGFLDDDLSKDGVVGPVEKTVRDAEYIIGINNSKTREEIVERISPSLRPCEPLIHPSAVVGKGCKLGLGVAIQAGVTLTTDVVLEDHVHVNVGSTISQGSHIGQFSTISPGVHIAGEVNVGEGVQIGVGASIINLINITENVVLGAGAIVVRDITHPGTYVGIPAKRIK